MDEKVPQHVINAETENKYDGKNPNRRDIVRGVLAVAAVGSAVGWGVYESRTGKNDRSTSGDLSDENEPNQLEGVAIGNAQNMRAIAENEPEAVLGEYFSITKTEAPSPSAFSELLVERLLDTTIAGCTPEERGQYTPETLADYQADMQRKYIVPAATALGDVATEAAPHEDIQATALHDVMADANSQMLEHYMKYMSDEGEAPVITTQVLRQEMGTPDPYNNLYPMEIDFEILIDSADSALLTISGSLNAILHTSTNTYKILLDDENPTPPFQFARG